MVRKIMIKLVGTHIGFAHIWPPDGSKVVFKCIFWRFLHPHLKIWTPQRFQRSADPCIPLLKFGPIRRIVDTCVPLQNSDRSRGPWIPTSLLKNSDRFRGPWIPAYAATNHRPRTAHKLKWYDLTHMHWICGLPMWKIIRLLDALRCPLFLLKNLVYMNLDHQWSKFL